jgi:hypothetical protein
MLFVPALAAMLTRWLSPGIISGAGLLIAACGLLLLGHVDLGASGSALIVPMLLIGFGAGLPWGLMDGLSMSVVPKERAGMATGIFNTTRVAGEGVALASVTAILAALSQSSLKGLLPDAATQTSARISQAAERIASGDIGQAAALLPEASQQFLTHAYLEAFQNLLYILISITVAAALIVFAFLGRKTMPVENQLTEIGKMGAPATQNMEQQEA